MKPHKFALRLPLTPDDVAHNETIDQRLAAFKAEQQARANRKAERQMRAAARAAKKAEKARAAKKAAKMPKPYTGRAKRVRQGRVLTIPLPGGGRSTRVFVD